MKKNSMVRKGLKQRCKWQEGVSCQRSEGHTPAQEQHTEHQTLWYPEEVTKAQGQHVQRLQPEGLDSQPGWGIWTLVPPPESSSQDQVPSAYEGFFPLYVALVIYITQHSIDTARHGYLQRLNGNYRHTSAHLAQNGGMLNGKQKQTPEA